MIETIGYNRLHKDREVNDFYATPIEEVVNILGREDISGTVLEPCCGMGHMAEGILRSNQKVNLICTDLIDRGYGEPGLNFISEDYPYIENIDTVIINPPFEYITTFVAKSLSIAKKKVILFARTQFLESVGRYNDIFSIIPPTRIYQYVDRVSCAKGGNFSIPLTANMSFSWFVWDMENLTANPTFYWMRKHKDYIGPKVMYDV